MGRIVLLFVLGLGDVPPVRMTGLSTTYHRGDGMSGTRLGCVAAARRLLGHNEFRDDLLVVATRGAPACGTSVLVENVRTGLRTWAVKLDGGPWGQDCPGGWRSGRALGSDCKWRGVADLSRRVAVAIGHDGRDTVNLRWHRRTR